LDLTEGVAMPAGPVNQLSLAVDATGQVIAAVDATQWAGSTPCTEWTVSDVVRHLVAGNFGFAKAVDGNPRPGFDVAALADADLLAAFRDSGAALVEAFGQPGALERIVAVPVGQVPGAVALHLRITEILVHGWDVATATGQQAEFPDDLAEAELTFSRGMLDKLPPGRIPFAPPQSVAQDAPAIQRLVACLGRNVGAVRTVR
jgi:uncharacterized protein (TIGR03086 family)